MRFDRSTAIVTGGGRGIGKAIAERLASDGACVVVADIDGTTAAATAKSISEHGGRALAFSADVAVHADVERLMQAAVDHYGRIDTLVNNAGIDLVASLDEMSYEDWRRMMSVDLDGAFLCIKHAAPHLARGGAGCVINIASIHAFQTQPNRAAYAAAKSALAGMTRALAIDLGPRGIRVNTIAPGYIRTDIWSLWLAELPDPRRVLAQIAQQHPLRKLGRPSDVAGAVAFLASEDAAFITGTVVVVDGGLTAMFAPPPI